jgi:hypothetical protein
MLAPNDIQKLCMMMQLEVPLRPDCTNGGL